MFIFINLVLSTAFFMYNLPLSIKSGEYFFNISIKASFFSSPKTSLASPNKIVLSYFVLNFSGITQVLPTTQNETLLL